MSALEKTGPDSHVESDEKGLPGDARINVVHTKRATEDSPSSRPTLGVYSRDALGINLVDRTNLSATAIAR